LVTTRDSLHTLAEHAMAPARFAATGRIGLRATPGGFGTPPFPGSLGERQVLVRDTALVVRDDGRERSEPITTVRAAAAFIGAEPGAPADLYTPSTPLDLDGALSVDAVHAREIADWFALGNEALQQLRTLVGESHAGEIQLWPEHFDLASTIDEVNYGASPGDHEHPFPYLYVGPFEARQGPFWNEPFGASLSRENVNDVAAAVGFFLEGRDLTR
jgi:hypothetical protein